MVFAWFISSFDKSERKVILDCDIGECEIDQVVDDINALIFMGLEHGAYTSSVFHEEDNSIASIEFNFPDDTTWKDFCSDFLKVSMENSKNADVENEE